MDKQQLYHQLQQADACHRREFDRYTKMLVSGFTRGRFYSEDEISEQLAKADAALADAQKAMEAFDGKEESDSSTRQPGR